MTSVMFVCRDVRSGVVLARSSQPEVGWLGWRNTQDESLLQAIAESCALHRGGCASTIMPELNHVDSVPSSVISSELLLLPSRRLIYSLFVCESVEKTGKSRGQNSMNG